MNMQSKIEVKSYLTLISSAIITVLLIALPIALRTISLDSLSYRDISICKIEKMKKGKKKERRGVNLITTNKRNTEENHWKIKGNGLKSFLRELQNPTIQK